MHIVTKAVTKTTVPLLLALGVAMAAPAAWSDQRNVDRTFDVNPGGRLTVDAEGGDVTVTGADSKQVVVHVSATASASALEGMTISAEPTADGVAVIVKRNATHWLGGLLKSGSEDIRVNVTVPRRYSADLRSSGGDLTVGKLQGNATGRTSGGDIVVTDIEGAVRMNTSGGDVKIESVRGDVDAKTSGGDIHAQSVRGNLEAHTSGGTVRAEQVSGSVKLGSSGGDVLADGITGPIAARTTGGDVRLEKIDGAIQANTSGGEIGVELVGANRGIDVSTSGSDIFLQLPSAVTATVDASAGSGKVKSELPITGLLDGKSKVQGTINGGGEPIRARTSGGDIVLQAKR